MIEIDAIEKYDLSVGNIVQLTDTAGRAYPLLNEQREWVFTPHADDAKGKLLAEALARVTELETALRWIGQYAQNSGIHPMDRVVAIYAKTQIALMQEASDDRE